MTLFYDQRVEQKTVKYFKTVQCLKQYRKNYNYEISLTTWYNCIWSVIVSVQTQKIDEPNLRLFQKGEFVFV